MVYYGSVPPSMVYAATWLVEFLKHRGFTAWRTISEAADGAGIEPQHLHPVRDNLFVERRIKFRISEDHHGECLWILNDTEEDG